jgi:hypothetical protein
MTMKTTLNFIAAAALGMSVTSLTGCFDSSDPEAQDTTPTAPTTSILPADIVINGLGLACDATSPTVSETFTSALAVDDETRDPSGTGLSAQRYNISKTKWDPDINNTPKRLAEIVDPVTPDGSTVDTTDWRETQVHPMIVSHQAQVTGNYELGDGSADIGDPDNRDQIFVSLSLDNGKTWKNQKVSDSEDKTSIQVSWDTSGDGIPENNVPYYGHSHKPTMAVQRYTDDLDVEHEYILVAWLDKYCPSGNPFNLEAGTGEVPYPDDYFKVNGTQGSIDYDLPCTIDDPLDPDFNCAPNGKAVYEVPYSCVWTVRGEFAQETDEEGNPVSNDDGIPLYTIEWRQPQQLTSGNRDANKIWIASSGAGFAITWQEDPEGLRSGKGAGPGVGWSGATTNHGADIWFTKINMENFAADDPLLVDGNDVPLPYNYDYPVRITDNEKCNGDTDTKLYCQAYCEGSECVTNDLDMLSLSRDDGPYNATLDGDTGASRPAMKILKTDADEYVVILGYEETKGLSESLPQEPNQDQGDVEITIEDEGKSVYFESFLFPTVTVMEAAAAGALPVISAGKIVNVLTPTVTVATDAEGNDVATETSDTNFENARRLVIMTHVDPCVAENYTFGFMYKQGIYTQGGPSDMFIRMNTGFSYDTFEGTVTNEDGTAVTNVSSHDVDEEGNIVWTEDNLADQTYDIIADNTFSPRGWLRGADIITGFEYTPNWDQSSHGCIPNNFHLNVNLGSAYTDADGVAHDAGWSGPIKVTNVQGCTSTLDPRITPTPKGKDTVLESDVSDPDVIFVVYGTYDMETGEEEDLFYTRSTDRGLTWETIINPVGDEVAAKLAARQDVQEKEAQVLASPDGTMLFTVWNQESHEEPVDLTDRFLGLDSWHGRLDYDVVQE